CPRCTRKPVRHADEVESRYGEDVTEMRSGQPSIPRVAHSAPPHTLRDGALDASAARIGVGIVAGDFLRASLLQGLVLFAWSNSDSAAGILCSRPSAQTSAGARATVRRRDA